MGIIDQTMQQGAAPQPAAQAAPQAAPGEPSGQPQYKTKVVEAIPPNLRDAFERVILAGMKVMYSPETADMVEEVMSGPGEVWKKLGEGVAGLMMLLDKQSGKGIPQDIIIPAAIELVHEAADHLNKTGQEVSEEDVKTATQYVAVLIAKKFGANDQQIMGMFGGNPAQSVGGQGSPKPEQQEA